MDLGDLAELMRATRPFVRGLIKRGKIPAIQLGKGKYLITRRLLLDTLDKLCIERVANMERDDAKPEISDTTN